ncbi:hypothetical protein B5C34_07525 [Pacificimonas flava]|uniref:CYTH domain-containing protein n=2 Tax=Pacificimonas TaxID=1960290 RepID=A0A219B680_9SPHN|nr:MULTISPECIES: CYTH domain-containing protein [Pacificimonas]MBZ6379490.1 CYTH domain-containing protein [Pacificimonas aurantium]OWV33319.1 hypothetical protein B5C34_07525 [Pacificimonas flava]
MGREIERKFLAASDGWRAGAASTMPIRQAYFDAGGDLSIRVRVLGDDEAVITIKGGGKNTERSEFEYPIPVEDADALMDLAPTNPIRKTRHKVPVGGSTFEVDEFHGRHSGLVIAELELEAADAPFPRPDWLGEEVTGDERYYNAVLARNES